jgi:tRNA(His) guanylyltransferase
MANSRFTYVRDFELADKILPNTYMLVRIDGKGFHRLGTLQPTSIWFISMRTDNCIAPVVFLLFTKRFSSTHDFAKPNDKRALDLMDRAAKHVMHEVADVIVAFVQVGK